MMMSVFRLHALTPGIGPRAHHEPRAFAPFLNDMCTCDESWSWLADASLQVVGGLCPLSRVVGSFDGPVPICDSLGLGASSSIYRSIFRFNLHDDILCCWGM